MISSILTGSKSKLSRLMLETVQWCSLAERDDETLLATSQFISLFNSKFITTSVLLILLLAYKTYKSLVLSVK